MMKLNSIIYLYPFPLALPPCRAALRFTGPLRAFAKSSAKGIPLGTLHRAAVLLTAPAKGGFLSNGRLWITFYTSSICQMPKNWALWIRFVSA